MKEAKAFSEEVNRYIAEREKLDPAMVYEQLKNTFPLVLTMAPCYDYEIPILCGQSSAGKFELWDNGLDIIFNVERPDGSDIHWHPNDVESAVTYVAEFMQGRSDYEMRPFGGWIGYNVPQQE